MSMNTEIQRAAQVLSEQYRANQLFVLPAELVPASIDEAYGIQRQFQTDLSRDQGPIAGYKLAYTTAIMQQTNGVNEPCMGIMLANNIRRSPCTLAASDFVRLGIECEVAARLGDDLPPSGAPFDRDKVSGAVESLMTAFEVIDNRRTPGLEQSVQFITGVAANIYNAGVVLGSPVTDWRAIDLVSAYGSMDINGEKVGDGHGSDVMGHPLEPLAWLANKLAEQGLGLSAGMVIITGSIVSPKFLEAGDKASISIEGLGSAELIVT